MTEAERQTLEEELEKLQQKKVDHLLLLVGANPLPNAVAGKLLLNQGGKITFICSAGTEPLALRIAQFLGLPQDRFKTKRVEEWQPSSIREVVGEKLGNGADSKKVGLHYTGGTKAMSVHAYRAAEEWARNKRQDVVYSYLDARRHQIVFDAVGMTEDITVKTDPIRERCEIGLEQLMALHVWEFAVDGRGQKVLPEEKANLPLAAEEIRQLHATPEGAKKWQNKDKDGWFDKQFNPLLLGDKWKRKDILQKAVISLPNSDDFAGIVARLQEELKLGEATSFQIGQAVQLRKSDGTWRWRWHAPESSFEQEFCKWFQGGWLEHIVLSELKQLQHVLFLHDVRRNVYCWVNPHSSEKKKQNFELDVVALRGHQLFAFSCGKGSNHKHLKLKLFEADMRARQLGGDQACVALVCTSDDPDLLEQEVRRTMDSGNRVKVFGRKHLKRLNAELIEWINSQYQDDLA